MEFGFPEAAATISTASMSSAGRLAMAEAMSKELVGKAELAVQLIYNITHSRHV